MQEETLLDLYFSRSETALEQTKQQYGTYCYAIAYRILAQPQDAEECENETYWKAWQVIPPNRPHSLKAFLRSVSLSILPQEKSKQKSCLDEFRIHCDDFFKLNYSHVGRTLLGIL